MHAILSTWETSEAHHNGIQYIDYYIYFLSFFIKPIESAAPEMCSSAIREATTATG